ncbi:MAG: N-acetylglucosamine-6-phosphate deacetylase [Clostridia bacterium]|nr:N-acetylglucosamine-6-phosphate deacetylase [Clostridia bacterium]
MKHRVAFVDGLVFDSSTESFRKVNIFCEDGYIVDMGEDSSKDGYATISLNGKHIIPGLIDVHTHGIGGYDFNLANEEEVAKMCRAYAKFGTTSVMATLASAGYSKLMNSIFAINPNRLSSKVGHANLIGIHMEGRYLNPVKKGAHNPEYLALPNLEELDELAQAMMPAPLHFSIAPELEGGEAFIKKAKEYGATVGVAHTNATYEEACLALSWGATSFTHTFNAMTAIHHRMPGATTCALTKDNAYAEVICDGMHLHPAIVRLIYKAKPTDKLVLITDSLAAAGGPDGEYRIAGTSVIVKNGCAMDENGTLAGSTLTMFKALKNFMSFCGLPLNKALKYATVNPASMVGAPFVGKLEKCYRADFIVLSDIDNPEIQEVYVGGRKVENE